MPDNEVKSWGCVVAGNDAKLKTTEKTYRNHRILEAARNWLWNFLPMASSDIMGKDKKESRDTHAGLFGGGVCSHTLCLPSFPIYPCWPLPLAFFHPWVLTVHTGSLAGYINCYSPSPLSLRPPWLLIPLFFPTPGTTPPGGNHLQCFCPSKFPMEICFSGLYQRSWNCTSICCPGIHFG